MDNRLAAIESGEGIDWATGRGAGLRHAGRRGPPGAPLAARTSSAAPSAQRHSVLYDQETDETYTPLNNLAPRPGALRGHQLDALGGGGARLRVRLLARRAARADALGSPVRRLRQRRAGGHRPVHLVGRAQVVPHVGPRDAAAARLRRAGAGALLGPSRALPAALRRRQYAGRQLHDPGQLLPRPAPAGDARFPQAADPDDAEVAAPPQAGNLGAGRDGPGIAASIACSGTMPKRRARRRRRSSSPPTRRSAASSSARARSTTTCSRSARSAASTTSTCSASSSSIRSRPRRCSTSSAASRTPRSSGARKSPRTWAPGRSSSPISTGCSTRWAARTSVRAMSAGRPRPRRPPA